MYNIGRQQNAFQNNPNITSVQTQHWSQRVKRVSIDKRHGAQMGRRKEAASRTGAQKRPRWGWKTYAKTQKCPPTKKQCSEKADSLSCIILVNFGRILHIFAFSCVILLNFAWNFPKHPKKTVKWQRKHPKLSQKRAKFFVLENESSELFSAAGYRMPVGGHLRVCFPSSFTFWHL